MQEILSGLLSGREADVGNLICKHAVHFLGEGAELPMGPQSCLDMPHRDLRVGRRESSHERGGGISVDQHHVRLELSQCIGNLRYECCSQVRKRLALLHDCLLYTSDAADDLLCVDLGGRRIIKKKKL